MQYHGDVSSSPTKSRDIVAASRHWRTTLKKGFRVTLSEFFGVCAESVFLIINVTHSAPKLILLYTLRFIKETVYLSNMKNCLFTSICARRFLTLEYCSVRFSWENTVLFYNLRMVSLPKRHHYERVEGTLWIFKRIYKASGTLIRDGEELLRRTHIYIGLVGTYLPDGSDCNTDILQSIRIICEQRCWSKKNFRLFRYGSRAFLH